MEESVKCEVEETRADSLPPVGERDVLVVIDMQNDFLTGALKNPDAEAIVPAVNQRIHQFVEKAGWENVYFTRDTHHSNYCDSQEGKHLPVPHCLFGTEGWELGVDHSGALHDHVIDKPTFGSIVLGEVLREREGIHPMANIEMIGTCTDICVIANAIIVKTYVPEVPLRVVGSLCAGTTPESHQRSLDALKVVQVDIY